MMKYQKPEMEVIEFEKVSIVTESNLYTEGTTGGNESGGKLDWGSGSF